VKKNKLRVGKGTAWLTTAIISSLAFTILLFTGKSLGMVGLMAWISILSAWKLGESAKGAKE